MKRMNGLDGPFSEREHLFLTCPVGPYAPLPLYEEVKAMLAQLDSKGNAFIYGVTGKHEQSFVIIEFPGAVPQEVEHWVKRNPRITSYVNYHIPLAPEEPPHAAYVLAALEAWLKQQGKQIIPDATAPEGFRVVSVAEKGAANGRPA